MSADRSSAAVSRKCVKLLCRSSKVKNTHAASSLHKRKRVWDRNTTNSGMWSLHGQLYLAWRKCSLIELRKPHPTHTHTQMDTHPYTCTPTHTQNIAVKTPPHKVNVQIKPHLLLIFNVPLFFCHRGLFRAEQRAFWECWEAAGIQSQKTSSVSAAACRLLWPHGDWPVIYNVLM